MLMCCCLNRGDEGYYRDMTNMGDTPQTPTEANQGYKIFGGHKFGRSKLQYNVRVQNGDLRVHGARVELPEIIEIEGGGNKFVFRKDADSLKYTVTVPKNLGQRSAPHIRHIIPKISSRIEKIDLSPTNKGKRALKAWPKTIKPMAYMDTNDAVVAFKAVQAFQSMLSKGGYDKIEITDVESGSIFLKFKAWLNGEDGQSAVQVVKDTIVDYATVGDQAAKDIIFNERRSRISKTNAETFSTYIEHLKGMDNAAFAGDGWLIIKLTDVNGKTTMLSQKISLEKELLLEKNPALLQDPKNLLQNLGLESQLSIEQPRTGT